MNAVPLPASDEAVPRGPRKLFVALSAPPNLVTLSRLALIGAAFGAAGLGAARLALLLGFLAGASDYVDGWLARRTGRVTRLGEILDQFCDVVVELACLVCAIGAGALPLAALVPWVLREVWVVSLRRSSIELGENIPTHWTGKLKAAFLGWSALPLFAGLLRVGGAASGVLLQIGRAGVAVGLCLSVVSGVAYTASWVRIYEARGPDTP
ncbi:MAG: phosphatidylglycerophosphate synthase [Myxococcales bacterium]|nr:phosphatidylglycerophosphate synthase [Myxococcales bacterium]